MFVIKGLGIHHHQCDISECGQYGWNKVGMSRSILQYKRETVRFYSFGSNLHGIAMSTFFLIFIQNPCQIRRSFGIVGENEQVSDQCTLASIDMTQQADEAQVDYEATEARQSALRNEVAEVLNQLEVSE